MGSYLVSKADHVSIILVHEPITQGSQVIEIRNPNASGVFLPKGLAVGKRYTASLSLTEQTARIVESPVEPLPNTVENEAHIAAAAMVSEGGPVPTEESDAHANTEKEEVPE